jgi:glycosyltransferase involved in cell wall biosynthesis
MISIVTICYNESKNIQKTIESINSQSNKNYEHIIKDGLSTDNTIEIANEFKSANRKIFSYADDGIYNAFNQALSYCSGDYVNFLNAGDYYTNPNVLDAVINLIKKTNCDLVYGDLNIYRVQNDTEYLVRQWEAGKFKKNKLCYGWMPPHPTVFLRKKLISNIGSFNEKYNISGDYDLLLRALHISNISTGYLNNPIVNMRYGGVSQSRFIQSFIEDTRIGFKYGYIFLPLMKRFIKIGQLNFLKRK